MRIHPVYPPAPDLGDEHRAKSEPPQPHRFVTYFDATLMEQVLNISQRQREADGRGRGPPDRRHAANLYRWRRLYGGMGGEQPKRLKELEKENQRLRRAVSDLTLDKLILTEAAKGNY